MIYFSGKRSFDPEHPDFIPSILISNKSKPKNSKIKLGRYERAKNRAKKKITNENIEQNQKEDLDSSNDNSEQVAKKYVDQSTQTDKTEEDFISMKEELAILREYVLNSENEDDPNDENNENVNQTNENSFSFYETSSKTNYVKFLQRVP